MVLVLVVVYVKFGITGPPQIVHRNSLPFCIEEGLRFEAVSLVDLHHCVSAKRTAVVGLNPNCGLEIR